MIPDKTEKPSRWWLLLIIFSLTAAGAILVRGDWVIGLIVIISESILIIGYCEQLRGNL